MGAAPERFPTGSAVERGAGSTSASSARTLGRVLGRHSRAEGGEHPLWHDKSVADSRAVGERGWPLLLLLPTGADAH